MALAAEEPRVWLPAAGLSSWHGFGMCLWDSPGCTTELASMGNLAGRRACWVTAGGAGVSQQR